jgi:hydrogenase maturation protease
VNNPVNILVAGIGNIFLGDDGFGCEVLRRLAMRPQPEGVRVVDYGIRSFDLTYALLDPPETTILVDAISRGGPPGTVYTIEPDLAALDKEEESLVDMHGMDPLRVLCMVKSSGGRFRRILLVGCEPNDFGDELEGRMGLSPPVAAAIDQAVELVEALVKNTLLEVAA